ncbi:LON peptidase substrate-binding domain-containing protein [Geodermatophilus sp. YIM 151500]|uniref:LON peptidase substrate-binding domain-containing protein n=1 Tax=Geodermatophilus sp. YIM 151500 TaxID=2984531 RepID=UPI0021E4C62C|nr:LON peptidase substrate-binding domain-containing protein [Geodermatophilus sp. YIM 151500]MCV2491716.1 LON peptidase substrate-binding domain-containing protein [Geodermatophilus sp. YIM 151500]
MGELIPLFPLGTPLFPGVVLPLRIFEPRYRRLVRDLLALPAGSDRQFFGVVAIRQGWEVEKVAPAEALYDIGCTARLQVVRPQQDGTFQLVTVGGDRFRLLDVVAGEDPPYLQAEIEWLAEEEAAEEAAGDHEGLVGPPALGGPGSARDEVDEVASSVARGSMRVLVRVVGGLFARYVTEVAALRTGREDDGGGRPGDDAGGLEELAPAAVSAAGDTDDPEVAGLLRAVAGDPTALSYLVASTALLTTEDRQALLAESATRRRLAAEARMLRRELTLLRALGAVPVPLAQFAAPMTVN